MFQCLILCVMIIDIINYMICLLRWNGLKGNLNNGLVMQSLVSCWSQQKLKTLIFMTIMLNFGPCYNNWNRILGWALIALFQKGPFCTWLCNFVFGPNYGPQNIDPKSVTLFDTLRHFRHILYKSITRLERDRNRDLHNNPVILVVYSALHAILNKILAVQIWKWNEFRITSEKAHLFIFIPFHRGIWGLIRQCPVSVIISGPWG